MDRRDLLRIAGLIVALLAIVGVVLLVGGGGATERSTGQARGVLVAVTETNLDLRTEDGGVRKFEIRPEDLRRLDLFHLRQHASASLPSIVHYEKVGDTFYAVRVDDA